jgi:hypothetical protein
MSFAPLPPPVAAPLPQTKSSDAGGTGSFLTDILMGDGRRQGLAETVAKSMLRTVGSQFGTQISRSVLRGVLGSILK